MAETIQSNQDNAAIQAQAQEYLKNILAATGNQDLAEIAEKGPMAAVTGVQDTVGPALKGIPPQTTAQAIDLTADVSQAFSGRGGTSLNVVNLPEPEVGKKDSGQETDPTSSTFNPWKFFFTVVANSSQTLEFWSNFSQTQQELSKQMTEQSISSTWEAQSDNIQQLQKQNRRAVLGKIVAVAAVVVGAAVTAITGGAAAGVAALVIGGIMAGISMSGVLKSGGAVNDMIDSALKTAFPNADPDTLDKVGQLLTAGCDLIVTAVAVCATAGVASMSTAAEAGTKVATRTAANVAGEVAEDVVEQASQSSIKALASSMKSGVAKLLRKGADTTLGKIAMDPRFVMTMGSLTQSISATDLITNTFTPIFEACGMSEDDAQKAASIMQGALVLGLGVTTAVTGIAGGAMKMASKAGPAAASTLAKNAGKVVEEGADAVTEASGLKKAANYISESLNSFFKDEAKMEKTKELGKHAAMGLVMAGTTAEVGANAYSAALSFQIADLKKAMGKVVAELEANELSPQQIQQLMQWIQEAMQGTLGVEQGASEIIQSAVQNIMAAAAVFSTSTSV